MKKTIKSLLAIAITAFAFTACSDVPEPYQIPGTGGGSGGGGEISGATGTGQLTDPYNCVAAINTGGTTDWVFIKGKVCEVKEEYTTQYGNGTFYISDDGSKTNKFYVYRAYYLGNKKFADGDTQSKVGDDVIVCGIITNYNGTIETTQNKGFIYELNGVNRGGDPTGGGSGGGEQKGTGSETDPFNVAAAVAKCKATGETATTESYYIKGIANTDYTVDQYKNVTVDIVDAEGASEKFTVYRVKDKDGKGIKEGYKIAKGATIIVYGPVVNFKGNTPETATGAYLVSVNGQAPEVEGGASGGGDVTPGTPAGTGTQADPFNVAAAVAKCKEAGETATTDIYYVKGIVNADYTVDSYKNATVDLVDAEGATEKFTAFRVKGADGASLKEGYKIPKGATVIVSGKLVNYKGNTPETAQNSGTLISVNGQAPELDGGTSGGGGEQGGGGTASSLTNGDFETWANGLPTGWKSASTASSATLEQSTDAHGGSYAVNVKGNESSNVRLASQEITLAAGTYTFSFWVKATTADAAQARPGYVKVVNNAVSGSYNYDNYANLSTSWQQVSYEFTLDAETTVCLVVMNPKKSNYSSGKDILIDDATLTKK